METSGKSTWPQYGMYFNSTKVQFGDSGRIEKLPAIKISIPLRYNLEIIKLNPILSQYYHFNSTKVQFGEQQTRWLSRQMLHFNSTKVQFGAGIGAPLGEIAYYFNSTKVQFGDTRIVYSEYIEYFNSTKVQFGGEAPPNHQGSAHYFNSTKVQFGEKDKDAKLMDRIKFQFH